MRNTWASGAMELLQHAEEHLQKNSSFDRKMAFISIDNCVELTLKSYLSLPKRFWKEKSPTRSELDNAYNSFPALLDSIEQYAINKVEGVELIDIEHYHRIRNTLYHQGTGLSVNEEYLLMYYSIAKILLKNLFGIEFTNNVVADKSKHSILMLNWSEIESWINDILKQHGIGQTNMSKWSILREKNLIPENLFMRINKTRAERNRIAHGHALEISPNDSVIDESSNLIIELKGIFDSYSKKHKLDYNYNEISELKGELIIRSFFGPPNYGEDPINDSREDAYILKLKYPINVISENKNYEEGDFEITELNLEEIHIAPSSTIRQFIGKHVVVKGTFFHAHTGHHHTPVLLSLKEIREI